MLEAFVSQAGEYVQTNPWLAIGALWRNPPRGVRIGSKRFAPGGWHLILLPADSLEYSLVVK